MQYLNIHRSLAGNICFACFLVLIFLNASVGCSQVKCYIGTCLSLTAFGLFAVVCVIVTDHIYTALFSALVQTHCAHVAMWFWISDCILSQRSFVLIHRSSLLRALFGCYINCYINCHVKLRPSRRTFCVHHITMHQFTVHFLQSHIRRVHVCIAVTCYLHSCQKYLDLLRATAVTRGRNGYRIKSHHEKLILEKNILPPLLLGIEPATFSITSPTL